MDVDDNDFIAGGGSRVSDLDSIDSRGHEDTESDIFPPDENDMLQEHKIYWAQRHNRLYTKLRNHSLQIEHLFSTARGRAQALGDFVQMLFDAACALLDLRFRPRSLTQLDGLLGGWEALIASLTPAASSMKSANLLKSVKARAIVDLASTIDAILVPFVAASYDFEINVVILDQLRDECDDAERVAMFKRAHGSIVTNQAHQLDAVLTEFGDLRRSLHAAMLKINTQAKALLIDLDKSCKYVLETCPHWAGSDRDTRVQEVKTDVASLFDESDVRLMNQCFYNDKWQQVRFKMMNSINCDVHGKLDDFCAGVTALIKGAGVREQQEDGP